MLKSRESVYGFKERYDDLNRAYREALTEGYYTTQYEAMKAAVNKPSKRFWVSSSRLVEVINAMESGKDTHVNPTSIRMEMYRELYKRYLEYKKEHPDVNKLDICEEIIYSQAPKFYMNASWGIKILYQGLKQYKRR